MIAEKSDLITVKDAAAIIGCSRVTLWRWMKSGDVDRVEVAGKVFVVRAQAERLIGRDARRKR